MGVWIFFVIILIVSILIGIKKGLVKTGIEFFSKIITFVSSFFITRMLVNLFSVKIGNEISKFMTNEYGTNLLEVSTIEEFLIFIISIIGGLGIFFIVYSLISIILAIVKFIFFRDKDDSNLKVNPVISKVLISIMCLISTTLSFIMILTPIGVIYNSVSDKLSERMPIWSEAKLPFVSEFYFNKLTEMPKNIHNIKSTEEIKYTANLMFSAIDIYKNGNKREFVNSFKENFEKSYFLPTVIAEIGSSSAKRWKNGEDYFNLKFDIPDGREGELSVKFLDILEDWDKQTVVEDVNTLINISSVVGDYGTEKFTEKDGLLYALADENFTEDLFVVLYSNDDFSQMVPAVVEYGLGTAFDYMNLEIDEATIEEMKIDGTTEDDAKRQARIVSKTIKNVLKVKEIAEQLNDNEINKEDVEKVVDELSELKDNEILSDVADELIYQLKNNVPNIQY